MERPYISAWHAHYRDTFGFTSDEVAAFTTGTAVHVRLQCNLGAASDSFSGPRQPQLPMQRAEDAEIQILDWKASR